MSKQTPLYQEHKKAGARFTEFGGWDMPVQYSSIIDEHNDVRLNVGIFDTSHMGLFIISGEKNADFLNKLTTADIHSILPGKAKYTLFLNNEGGIIDDLIVYRRKEDFLMVVNAGNTEKDFNWLKKNIIPGVTIENIGKTTSLLALQGPDAEKIMQPLIENNLSELKYFNFIENPSFKEIKPEYSFLARTGYTGEDGFEIFIPNNLVETVWKTLLDSGAKPCGLGCRDTLRLEACMALHGHEISDSISPLQAKLGWTIFWDKEFIGKEALLKQKDEGVNMYLAAFTMESGIARADCEIFVEGKNAGKVTSGSFSPTFKRGIGLGYVNRPLEPDESIEISVHKQLRPAVIVKRPFYSRKRC